MQNKAHLELEDFEAENLAKLQKMFSRKWEFVFMQAEAQYKWAPWHLLHMQLIFLFVTHTVTEILMHLHEVFLRPVRIRIVRSEF